MVALVVGTTFLFYGGFVGGGQAERPDPGEIAGVDSDLGRVVDDHARQFEVAVRRDGPDRRAPHVAAPPHHHASCHGHSLAGGRHRSPIRLRSDGQSVVRSSIDSIHSPDVVGGWRGGSSGDVQVGMHSMRAS